MKAYEFIEKNIGNKVYVTGDGDLAMCRHLRRIIFYKVFGVFQNVSPEICVTTN